MTEPTTPAPTSPAPGAPGAPTPATPPADPPAPGDPAAPGATPPDDGPVFTNERDRRRWAELTGRIGRRERERDEAQGRITALLTREAERMAASSLAVPTDLWLAGATVADLLTEDGADVDAAKVKAIVDQLTAARPGLRVQPQPSPLPGGHRLPPAEKPATFAEAIQELTRGRI